MMPPEVVGGDYFVWSLAHLGNRLETRLMLIDKLSIVGTGPLGAGPFDWFVSRHHSAAQARAAGVMTTTALEQMGYTLHVSPRKYVVKDLESTDFRLCSTHPNELVEELGVLYQMARARGKVLA